MGRILVETIFGLFMFGCYLLERQDASRESSHAALADSSERLQGECEYWHAQAMEARQRADHLEQQIAVVELANQEDAAWTEESNAA